MTNKEITQGFLKLASKVQSRKAFELYVADNFKHHNINFKGDGNTLMIVLEENAKKYPDLISEIKRVLEGGNFVAVHSHARATPNDLGLSLMHIFQFDNDKILELWDFGQAVPENMVNENGMF